MDLHARYLQQASWTRDLRAYLMGRAGIDRAQRILELGCGTGAILRDLTQPARQTTSTPRDTYGLDLDRSALDAARSYAPGAILIRGDAQRLPFADSRFDITCCHFLLMWLADPLAAIREMRRITRPSGHVLALAEPDYTAREDRPVEFEQAGFLQVRALAQKGADIGIGSRVAHLFNLAGLTIVEAGTIARQDPGSIGQQHWINELATLRQDLVGQLAESDLKRLEQLDLKARRSRQRALYVPTYFVHAQV